MKFSFLTIFLFVGSLAQATTCFFKSPEIHPELPTTLCLEEISARNDSSREWVQISGGNMEGSYDLWSHYNGDVVAEMVYEKIGGDLICGEEEIRRISIDLPRDFQKSISASLLKVSMQTEYTRDNCHSMPDVEKIEYKRIK